MSMKNSMLSVMGLAALISKGMNVPSLHITGKRKKRKYPLPQQDVTNIPKGHQTQRVIASKKHKGFEYAFNYEISGGTLKTRMKAITKAEAMFTAAIMNDSHENLKYAGVIIFPIEILEEKA